MPSTNDHDEYVQHVVDAVWPHGWNEYDIIEAHIRRLISLEQYFLIVSRPWFGKVRRARWDRRQLEWFTRCEQLAGLTGASERGVQEAFGSTYGSELDFSHVEAIKDTLLAEGRGQR